MRHAGIAAIAFAALTGLAMPASAITFGQIGANNDGVNPIYGTATRAGFFDANLYLTGVADLTVTYLGSEAGFNNSFWWAGSQIFATGGNTNAFSSSGFASQLFTGVAAGLLNFAFLTGEGVTDTNGSNSRPAPNFFVSFDDPNASSGTSVTLWLDDSGSPDDNHDDMAIRLSVVGPGQLSEVPVPAAGLLLLGGLGALAGLRRRRKS